jgi:hypothetical protein
LAANGSYAAESSTANSAQKSALHPSAHSISSPADHPAAKKAVRPTTASHSAYRRTMASHGTATPRAGSAQYAARKTAPHAPSAYAAKRVPNHTTAYASQHRVSSARNRYSKPAPARTLSGQQRLGHLHLQPQRVQEIQQALVREGYLQGDASGQWDSRTHDAMLRYQAMHGFPATGLPEAKSLMKLGLGSHPLPPELDHAPAAVATPGAAQGNFTVSPPSPPVSQAIPPS